MQCISETGMIDCPSIPVNLAPLEGDMTTDSFQIMVLTSYAMLFDLHIFPFMQHREISDDSTLLERVVPQYQYLELRLLDVGR